MGFRGHPAAGDELTVVPSGSWMHVCVCLYVCVCVRACVCVIHTYICSIEHVVYTIYITPRAPLHYVVCMSGVCFICRTATLCCMYVLCMLYMSDIRSMGVD